MLRRRRLYALLFGLLISAPAAAAAPRAIAWEKGGFDGALAKAAKAGKPLVAEFYAEWCPWCKKMAKDTFPDAALASFVGERLVAVQVNAEKAYRVKTDFALAHHVGGYPTFIVFNPKGEEIDRVVGYMGPKEFKTALEDLLAGKGTLKDLEARLAGGDSSPELLVKLGDKRTEVEDWARAKELYAKVIEADASGKFGAEALLSLAQVAKREKDYEKVVKLSRQYLDSFAKGEDRAAAHRGLIGGLTKKGDKDALLPAWRAYVAEMKDDPEALNSFAWWCSQERVALREGLAAAEHARTLQPKDGSILDTLAVLHFVMAHYDEAIKTEKAALALDPSNKEMKERLQSMIETRKVYTRLAARR